MDWPHTSTPSCPLRSATEMRSPSVMIWKGTGKMPHILPLPQGDSLREVGASRLSSRLKTPLPRAGSAKLETTLGRRRSGQYGEERRSGMTQSRAAGVKPRYRTSRVPRGAAYKQTHTYNDKYPYLPCMLESRANGTRSRGSQGHRR